MNKKRRQQLKEWKQKVEKWARQGAEIKDELESIHSEEEECFDMMPESLQGSANGMNSEEAIDKMNEAIECLDEAFESIESATECIEEII